MQRLIFALSLSAAPAFADVPKVATDIAPIHSLVSQVMNGVGTPDLIIPANASPHGYAMRPSEARNLAQADVVIWVGPTLTPWLDGPVETLAATAAHLVLADVPQINVLAFREGSGFGAHDHGHEEGHQDEHAEDDHEDHADGHDDHKEHADGHEDHADDHDGHDDHEDHADEDGHDDHQENAKEAGHDGMKDPHLWLDPGNASIWLMAIADQLAIVDPENADTYRDNAKQGQVAIALQEKAIAAQLAPVVGTPFIVFHDAFHYFEAHFEVEAVAAVSTGDAAKPGAARIASLRADLSDSGVHCAFTEPQIDASLLGTVTEGLDVKLGVLDPLGADLPLGPGQYAALLGAIADSMAVCLSHK
ncbi:MAG: zinc ABC transporter substrate-binding protein [Sulfitobacter sp.]